MELGGQPPGKSSRKNIVYINNIKTNADYIVLVLYIPTLMHILMNIKILKCDVTCLHNQQYCFFQTWSTQGIYTDKQFVSEYAKDTFFAYLPGRSHQAFKGFT